MLEGAVARDRPSPARREGASLTYPLVTPRLRTTKLTFSPSRFPPAPSRQQQVLQNADAIGCRKYLTPTSLVAGNSKLNLAFVANLFNTHPCLEPLEESERPVIEDFDAEGEREARVFTLWLNSLDVDPGVYDLFEDLKVRLPSPSLSSPLLFLDTDSAPSIRRTVSSSSKPSTK